MLTTISRWRLLTASNTDLTDSYDPKSRSSWLFASRNICKRKSRTPAEQIRSERPTMACSGRTAYHVLLLVALVELQTACIRGQPAKVVIPGPPKGLIPLDPVGIYGSLLVRLSIVLRVMLPQTCAMKRHKGAHSSDCDWELWVSLHAASPRLHAAGTSGCISDTELCRHLAKLPACCLPRCS